VEDSGIKISAIEENFGPKVANIVDALTVPKYASAEGNLVEDKMAGIRKIASAEYFSREAASVRLSDILDNIRDIEHIPPERQKRFAVASLVFLELLNHRLSPSDYSSMRCEVRKRALESILSGAPNHAQESICYGGGAL
jgi:guanosine-3',5'-bis(diphosphate) 3'-pyrophosphohydrolase